MNTLGAANVAQPTIPIHQQILAMATSPYGDNPIFKDLKPMSGPSEDSLKPTNPAAQNAIYESSINQFKVSPKVGNGIRIKPVTSSLSKVQKIIFNLKSNIFT
jgi:nuclear pore complex protein Nup98-Nup96